MPAPLAGTNPPRPVPPLPAAARYANTVEQLLAVPPVRRLMVRLPPAVEAVREQLKLKAGVFRTMRWAGAGASCARVAACLLEGA